MIGVILAITALIAGSPFPYPGSDNFWIGIASVGLLLSLLPVLLMLRNLSIYRPAPQVPAELANTLPPVSILIPARNEEASLPASIAAALACTGIELEVVVLDDHSTDRTPEIVRELSAIDPRVRLEQSPALPAGWCGKQHACWQLSQRTRHDVWLFLDADTRLTPTGLARSVALFQAGKHDLLSGVPRQETGTWLEKLLIPQIHTVLLGYLPLDQMRRSPLPSLGAGCGQFFLTHRAAYQQAGGHAAIRESLHDGVRLPRLYRMAGLRTDLFDATDAATCRMYHGAAQVWNGLAKNATEGMANPRLIGIFTVLLFGGHILPLVILIAQFPVAQFLWPIPRLALGLAWAGVVGIYGVRLLMAFRFRQHWLGVVLHPLAIVLLLGVQWYALIRTRLGLAPSWKGRSYTPT